MYSIIKTDIFKLIKSKAFNIQSNNEDKKRLEKLIVLKKDRTKK